MTNGDKISRQLLLLLTLFMASWGGVLSAATPKLHESLGGKNLQILKDAKFVTILTLVPDEAKNHYNSIQEIHLSQDEIDRLKRNLLDDHNYDFGRIKRCQFHPEISFKFQDDKDQLVHLFVSPSCNQILIGTDSHSVLLNYDPVSERLESFMTQLVRDSRTRNKATANR